MLSMSLVTSFQLLRSPNWTNRQKLRSQQLQVLQDNVDGFTEAFVGGSVGVMSVAILLELKKLDEKSFEFCPYCMGNGKLLCGICCGAGTTTLTPKGKQSCNCSICQGLGLVKCLNCQGDGRVTPMLLQSKAVRDPEYASLNPDV